MTTPRTETGGPTRTPRSEIGPLVSPERRENSGVEPVLLWDISTSTMWGINPDSDGDYPDKNSRRYVMTEAMRQMVRDLENLDTEATSEQSSGSDEMGGLLTFFFGSNSTDGEDLNTSNFDRKVNAVRWGGGTHIISAWNQALSEYDDEFGDKPKQEQPVHLVCIATDGELDDMDDFAQKALYTAGPHRVFGVFVFGADSQATGDRHSACLKQYQAIADQVASKDPHQRSFIHVISFDGVTNPDEIAEDIKTMVS